MSGLVLDEVGLGLVSDLGEARNQVLVILGLCLVLDRHQLRLGRLILSRAQGGLVVASVA